MCKICHQQKCPASCPNHTQQPMKQCDNISCNRIITSEYNYWTDNNNHICCSEECIEKVNGIVEKEWTDDDREYQR